MKLRMCAVLVAGITASAVGFAQDTKGKDGGKGAKSVRVKLMAQNDSKENGRAILTPEGDKTKVEISLRNAPKGVAQPAHIHAGSCANLDPKPKHGLENIVDGKSSTVVPVSLEELLKSGTAINVHKSKEEIKTYVSCGDIKGGAKKGSGG